MDMCSYINRFKRQSEKLQTASSNINKSFYLDIIEKVLDGYGYDYFEDVIQKKEPFVICIGLRASGALAYLLSQGRKQDWYDLWLKLMDESCDELHKKPDFAENDLAVKELMIALKLMKNKVDSNIYAGWYQKLKDIDPYETYNCIYREDDKKLCNMTVYNASGEYLRESEGMTDTTDYFDRHLPWVISRFDENGMFVDHDQAMLYDLTTRCQISVMMWYGYDGKYKEELDKNLEKAGMMTLFMQSSAFQLPYGGRSNQYLFNEALVASCCEYEAVRHLKKGNTQLAGMFKRCAHMSALSILRWLDLKPPKHNKNLFPHDSGYGTDSYGTYHRYLIALANFIGYGYLFADDSINECACPSEVGGYVLGTSREFHKVFANCRGNSIEIELAADLRYDSTGMGRYHKTGIPIELGLSMPFAAKSKFYIPEELERRDISICTGWRQSDGKIVYISEFKDSLNTNVNIIEQSLEQVIFTVEYTGELLTGCSKITEKFILDKDGVLIETELEEPVIKEVYFTVPLLLNNGREITEIVGSNDNSSDDISKHMNVVLKGCTYNIRCNGNIKVEENKYGNRNGIYKLAVISKNDTRLAIRLNLIKQSG